MKKFIGFNMMILGMIVLYGLSIVALFERFGMGGFYVATIALCLAYFGSYLFLTGDRF